MAGDEVEAPLRFLNGPRVNNIEGLRLGRPQLQTGNPLKCMQLMESLLNRMENRHLYSSANILALRMKPPTL